MSNLYSVAERLEVGDTIYWTSTAEKRNSNPSTVDTITETRNGIEVRVSGSGGGEYTLDFPKNKHPNTHWHPPDESKEGHREANHQERRGEVYVGRGGLLMMSIIGHAEDTPESIEHEPVKEAIE